MVLHSQERLCSHFFPDILRFTKMLFFFFFFGRAVQSVEKAMASHSSTLAWKILWMEEPGRLQSMGSLRVRHD